MSLKDVAMEFESITREIVKDYDKLNEKCRFFFYFEAACKKVFMVAQNHFLVVFINRETNIIACMLNSRLISENYLQKLSCLLAL